MSSSSPWCRPCCSLCPTPMPLLLSVVFLPGPLDLKGLLDTTAPCARVCTHTRTHTTLTPTRVPLSFFSLTFATPWHADTFKKLLACYWPQPQGLYLMCSVFCPSNEHGGASLFPICGTDGWVGPSAQGILWKCSLVSYLPSSEDAPGWESLSF